MREWRWIREDVALAIHDAQVAEHGGLSGVRDRALLQSALARPRQRAAYGEPDAAELAASYAMGIARNHPFVDGNKRVAWVVAEVFLLKHGFVLTAGNAEGVRVMLTVAEGGMPEEELARWYRANLQPAE